MNSEAQRAIVSLFAVSLPDWEYFNRRQVSTHHHTSFLSHFSFFLSPFSFLISLCPFQQS